MSALLEAARAAKRELELQQATAEQREIELTQIERWARDPLGWLDSGHIWISSPFNDSAPGRLRPVRLRLFAAQIATLEAWIDLPHLVSTGELRFRNIVIEKSRQIGETWAFAAAICWALHYHDVAGLAMHTKGAKIDDGGQRNTVESLFGKVRYIERRLPRAKLAGLGRLAFRPFSRDPAKIENAERASMVLGEGQTDDPGRGSTFDFALIDEAAFVEHGERVYSAIDEACPTGKALLSTVNGDGNVHARISDAKPQGWLKLRLHWGEHPVYSRGLHVAGESEECPLCAGNRAGVAWDAQNPRAHRYPGRLTSPWYDERVIGKTDDQVARELDIDRERALTGRVYSEFQSETHVVEAGIEYDPALPLELGADYGLDATSVVICQDAPAEYRVIGEIERGDLFHSTATPELVAQALRARLIELGVEERFASPFWTSKLHAIGDPSGQAKTLTTGRPFVEAYAKQGFDFRRPPTRLTTTVAPSITAVKRLLLGTPKPLRICGVKCPAFVRHMRNNTWPTDPAGQRRSGSSLPVDDEHNHMMRAFAYLIVSKFPPPVEDDPLYGPDPGDQGRERGLRRDAPLPYGSAL